MNISFRCMTFEGRGTGGAIKAFPHRTEFRVSRVKSVRNTGIDAPVYDLEVEGGNFIADAFVVHNTRWHEKDLIGFLLTESASDEDADQWRVIRLPAINASGEALWPARWPISKLKRVRDRFVRKGYPWMWDALYQQEPTEVLDAEWDPAYFGKHIWFDKYPDEVQWSLCALDPSVGHGEKTDYSAIVMLTVGKDGVIYIDASIQRRDAFKQVEDVLKWCSRYSVVACGVEINGFQGVLKDMFYKKCESMGYWPDVRGIQSRSEKRMRIRGHVTPFLANSLIRFRRGSPGTSLLLEQLRGFPSHKYDDGPDALSMAIALANHLAINGLEGDGHRLELPEIALA